MSFKFKIDTVKRIVFVKRFGLILPGEFGNALQEITCHPDFKNIDKLLTDATDSDVSTISTAELTKHAAFCKNKIKHLTVAIIAPKDLTFGISRMFEILSDLENIKVVREKKDALGWLKIKNLPEDFK